LDPAAFSSVSNNVDVPIYDISFKSKAQIFVLLFFLFVLIGLFFVPFFCFFFLFGVFLLSSVELCPPPPLVPFLFLFLCLFSFFPLLAPSSSLGGVLGVDDVVCFCGLVRMLLGGPELRGSLVCAEGAPLYSHLIPRVLNRLVSSSSSPFPWFVRRSTSDLYRKIIYDTCIRLQADYVRVRAPFHPIYLLSAITITIIIILCIMLYVCMLYVCMLYVCIMYDVLCHVMMYVVCMYI
jgi:hypothetical protein